MAERLLLNLFLSMTPVVAYQLIMFKGSYEPDSKRTQILLGILSGVSSVLCMMFPVVNGANFLWDLRWIPFLLTVIYGRFWGGTICTVLMLGYRAYLGGVLSWLLVAVDALVLFGVIRRYIGVRYHEGHSVGNTLVTSALVSAGSYLFVLSTIFLYFVLKHDAGFFIRQGALFYVLYGTVTMTAYVVSVMLIENLFKQTEIRRELQQAEKLHLLGDMAASFAHEIRNPLTVAKGFIQLTAESLETGKDKERMEFVVSELQRAEGIISDYLNFAKPQIDKAQVISAGDSLHSVASIMSPFAIMHKVEIQCETESNVYICVDGRKFKQLMMNIIKNAIEAIPNGGNVYIYTKQQQGQVLIAVKDDGVGMTESQLRRLGTPFYSTKAKGTGLGLMVTFRLVEAMGGRLQFKSVEGHGTTAMLQLPLYTVDEAKLP